MSSTTIIILSDSEDEQMPTNPLEGEPEPMTGHNYGEEPEPEEGNPTLEEDLLHTIAPQIFPPPIRAPSFQPYRERPNGPLRMMTPRKRVIPPQPVSLQSPQSETSRPRRRTSARRWNWLPHTLQEWREEEGIPSTFEVGESSNAPLTQEPVHQTIPLLVARVTRHDRELQEAQDDLESIEETLEGVRHRLDVETERNTQAFVAVHNIQETANHQIMDLHRRLEESEVHTRELERRLYSLERRGSPANSRT